MHDYETLSEAINDLRKRGYTEDFNLKPDCLESASTQLLLHPEDFVVDEFYRFEGMTNPDDSSVVYAVSSADGIKGILVDAYGAYAESLTPAMISRLTIMR